MADRALIDRATTRHWTMTNKAQLWLPVLATIGAMASFQIGAAVAKSLFSLVGPLGAAALRLTLGAALLMIIARPWRSWPQNAPVVPLVGLGLAMAATVLLFYLAISRLPLGAAISLQFLGPLGVAVFGSRRVPDLVWALLAAVGIWLLVGAGATTATLDLVGVAFALGAAVGWANYILLGSRVSSSFGRSTAALSVGLAALFMFPAGAEPAANLVSAPILIPIALLMALFSSAIPFSLEFYAMPRLPSRTFAVLMCLEPAFGVLFGLLMLGETLALQQIAGVAMVIIAASGASWSSTRPQVITGAPARKSSAI